MDQVHQETEQALQELEKYKALFGKIDENLNSDYFCNFG